MELKSPAYVYGLLLGSQTPFEHSTHADKFVYEAELAQRRYEQVDPSNRLVAATLEQRWNDALIELQDVRDQIDRLQ